MSDASAFLLLLVALYLVECVGVAPRTAVYVERRRGRVRVFGAAGRFGTRGHALDMGDPFAPVHVRFAVPLPQLSIGATGVVGFAFHAFNPGPRVAGTGVHVPFDGGGAIRADGSDLEAAGAIVARLGSERAARFWAERIGRARRAPAGGSRRVIEEALRDYLDVEAAAERVAAFEGAMRALDAVSATVLVFILAILPAAIALRGLAASWPWLLGGAVALQAAALAAAIRGRRRMAASFSPPEASRLIPIALSPISAARAATALGRDLLADFHPLAAAAALGPPEEIDPFAARVLRDLRRPFAADPRLPDAASRAIAEEFAALLEAALHEMLRDLGRSPELLAAGSEGGGAAGTQACPRCGTVYARGGSETCPDCGGLELAVTT